MALHRAVVPDRVLRRDVYAKNLGVDFVLGAEVSAEETCAVQRFTGLLEAALGNGVHSWVEVEFDGVAHGGFRLRRLELEAAITDFDYMHRSCGEGSWEGREC